MALKEYVLGRMIVGGGDALEAQIIVCTVEAFVPRTNNGALVAHVAVNSFMCH